MIHPSDIHTLTELKRDSARLLQRLEASARPQVITVDGRPRAVMLSVGAFERLSLLAEGGVLAGELPASSSKGDTSSPSAGAPENEQSAVRLREAFELLALAQALVEQRVRREDPSATEDEVEVRLAARRSLASGSEEAPGHLTRSAERLRKLLL